MKLIKPLHIVFVTLLFFGAVNLQASVDVDFNLMGSDNEVEEITNSTKFAIDNNIDQYSSDYYKELNNRDKTDYLLTSTGTLISLMLIGVGLLYIMPSSVTNWNKQGFHDLADNWWDNVSGGPVWDKDNWFINYVAHPYWGAVYYMQARNAGYSEFDSFLYSAFASTFLWEYGVEAFAEKPSIQDLIVTPVLGSLLGEQFYKMSNHIKMNHEEVYGSKFLGYTFLTLMDPLYLLINKTGLHNLTTKHENQMPVSGGTWGLSTHSFMYQVTIPVN